MSKSALSPRMQGLWVSCGLWLWFRLILLVFAGVGLSFEARATPTDDRLQWTLQENVNSPSPDPASTVAETRSWGYACYALAALKLGQNEATANSYLEALFTEFPVPDSDTSDFESYFKLHLVWRIYHDPEMNARLTAGARTAIAAAMWRWVRTRSRLSDAQGSEWMIHDSENHDAMQKAGFLLCLEALLDVPGYGPDMLLPDGNTLSQHAAAWNSYFMRYFPERARRGINVEIASPIYAKYTVGVYCNLRDFAANPTLRELAEKMLDLYWADTASDWTGSGLRGGAETRCYKTHYVFRGTSYSFHQLLWAYGWHENQGVARTYGLIPAVSSYRVPAIITAAATDPDRPNHLYTSRRFGRGGEWDANRDYTVVFDSGNSHLRRDTFVTKDYTMGTFTLDMNRQYIALIDQNRAMGTFFSTHPDDRVIVFGQGGTADVTKSFADLNGVTRANCMIVQRDKNVATGANSGTTTVIYISNNLWNNRVESGGWIFSWIGNAYCAIRPAGGTYTAEAFGVGMNLSLSQAFAPVIIQTGQSADYTDFADFQASVLANSFSYSSNTLNYTSEAGDTFTVYADSKTTPRVNGSTVDLNPAKTYNSPYLSMVHGESIATVSHPDHPDLLLDFSQPPQLIQLSPTDNAGNVSLGVNLIMTFDQTVMAASGLIVLRDASDGRTIETYDVASSPRLSFSGSQLVIDPTDDLRPGTGYELVITEGAVVGAAGKPFAGLTNPGDWNFTAGNGAPIVLGAVESFDSGTADATHTIANYNVPSGSGFKLILVASWENGSSAVSASWKGGQNFLTAVNSGGGRNAAILYLDDPAAGTGDIVLTYGAATASRVAVLRVSGLGDGVPVTSFASGPNGSLTTTAANSLVVGVHTNNGTALMTQPFTNALMLGDSGSSTGSAGYEFQAVAGQQNHSWAGTISGDNHALASFAPALASGFDDWITSYPSISDASGLDDDPDEDGIGNGIENLFGTAPDGFSKVIELTTAGNGLIQLEHPRSDNPAADLSVRYRWSTDLATFHDDGATDSAGTRVDFSVFKNVPVSGMTRVNAMVSGTPANKLFVVLQAVQD